MKLIPPHNTYPFPFRFLYQNLEICYPLFHIVYLLANLLLLHFEKIPSLITFAL